MKNKNYKMSKLKHEVVKNGKDCVIRKLTPAEVEYVSRFAKVEEWLYEITVYFAPSFSPKGKQAILKDLYFNYWLKHKSKVIKKLRKNEVNRCREAGMVVRPYKYKIWPNN